MSALNILNDKKKIRQFPLMLPGVEIIYCSLIVRLFRPLVFVQYMINIYNVRCLEVLGVEFHVLIIENTEI